MNCSFLADIELLNVFVNRNNNSYSSWTTKTKKKIPLMIVEMERG